MAKIYINTRNNLNEEMLKAHFELVNNSRDADFVISQSTLADDFLLDEEEDYSKVIYIAVEPPLAGHRLFCYDSFDKFNLVVTHNPDPNKDNQIPFTETDEPQYYPVNPDPSWVDVYEYEDLDLDRKPTGIFYAGRLDSNLESVNYPGAINLMKFRREIGTYIQNNFPSKFIGIGWNGQGSKVSDWRKDKWNQIKESNCDFVLALENTMYPNYLYEKIWDGFMADKVTLYLGDPFIEQHIPLNCFVDLREWFNPGDGSFDYSGFKERMDNFTASEYNEIRKNAREFRKTCSGRHLELQNKLTDRLINHIYNHLNIANSSEGDGISRTND